MRVRFYIYVGTDVHANINIYRAIYRNRSQTQKTETRVRSFLVPIFCEVDRACSTEATSDFFSPGKTRERNAITFRQSAYFREVSRRAVDLAFFQAPPKKLFDCSIEWNPGQAKRREG